MHVLVAEDEKKIAAFVRKGLAEIGCTVTVSHRGDEALHLASNARYDALVLDIMMPGCDGLRVLRSLREQNNILPVILLTARDSLNDRIDGLNQGADDYLAKPFSMEELIARLRAVARRLTGEGVTLLRLGDLTLNLGTQEAKRAGKKSISRRVSWRCWRASCAPLDGSTPARSSASRCGPTTSIQAPTSSTSRSNGCGEKLTRATPCRSCKPCAASATR